MEIASICFEIILARSQSLDNLMWSGNFYKNYIMELQGLYKELHFNAVIFPKHSYRKQ